MGRIDVGAKIKRLRHKHGWTQQQLASKIRETAGNMSQIEAGRHGVPLSNLYALAQAFEVHPLELIADLPPEACQIADEVATMSTEHRRLAVRLIRAIREGVATSSEGRQFPREQIK